MSSGIIKCITYNSYGEEIIVLEYDMLLVKDPWSSSYYKLYKYIDSINNHYPLSLNLLLSRYFLLHSQVIS